MSFRTYLEETKRKVVHPSAIEYVNIDLRKGKSIKVGVNHFFKKNPQGSENFMLGGTIDFGPSELRDAVMKYQAQSAIKGAMRMKDGMGYISLLGQAQSNNIKKDELAKYVKDELGSSDGNNILGDPNS